ncbi:MAG: hypothetical protein OHK0031_08110 [Anaerolineales bacterium]
MATVGGPDISFYQDDPTTPRSVDFNKLASVSQFVILRAGQNLWVDSHFKAYWSSAKALGLPRGSYWFYDSRADPQKQADLWVQTLGGDLGELPLFADIEENYNGSYKGWKNWYLFLERLRTLVGTKDIFIYTAYYYWRQNAPNETTQKANLEYFHRYPLWIAHYQVNKPSVPKPWGPDEWVFWQYTEKGDGLRYGVESLQIDLNYFNGDEVAFKTRFNLKDPVPAPLPRLGVDLNVRSDPNDSAALVVKLVDGDVFTRLALSADQTWMQIRRDDGVTGWVKTNVFIEQASVPVDPPPVDPPPVDPPPAPNDLPTGRMYRVSAASLRVRATPDTNAAILGSLTLNETVEEINATSDRIWLKTHRADGLEGWSMAQYLQEIQGTITPPAAENFRTWYQVTAASLNVREGPDASQKIIGGLVKDDTVGALSAPQNGWVQIARADGLSGWCSLAYLKDLAAPTIASLRQKLFNGVTYFRKTLTTPRPLMLHVLALDLNAAQFSYLVTPPQTADGVICTRTTSRFLTEFGAQIAINGDGYIYLPPESAACSGSDPVRPNGFAASRGKVYVNKPAETLYININNQMTIGAPKGAVYNAISGDRILLTNGVMTPGMAADVPAPRTAVGITKNGTGILLLVVDGRQPGYSEGVDRVELTAMLQSFGAYNAINMDGGGSSTLVIRGVDGAPRVLNRPIDGNAPGKERAVGNHLGIFAK